MESTDCLEYIISALDQIPTINMDSRILVPGVGTSPIAKQLYDSGYGNITVMDLEAEAINAQRLHFENIKGGVPTTVIFLQTDALKDAKPFSGDTFDVIVDKSFLDVFHTLGGSRAVQRKLIDCLKLEGVVLVISIYHLKWRGMFPRGKGWVVKYGSVTKPRYGSKRTSVKQLSNPICLLLASRGLTTESMKTIVKMGDATLRNLHGMSEWEFPQLEAGSM